MDRRSGACEAEAIHERLASEPEIVRSCLSLARKAAGLLLALLAGEYANEFHERQEELIELPPADQH